jgi:N-acetylglucosaminyl-diphospho-decaprenol L-rhamnosyltransferase
VKRKEESENSTPKVSFLIPYWNQRQLLEDCVGSILQTIRTIPHEIIVIDNASLDDSKAYMLQTFPEIFWIRNDKNLGYAKAINQGVGDATGEFLFFLNDDIRFVENTTEQLIDFLVKHPDAGAVAPMLIYPDGRIQISCRRFPTPPALFLQLFGIKSIGTFRAWKLDLEDQGRGGIVQQPMASALMVSRACWNAVGPMDERFFLYFNDVDWCYRLYRNTSYKIYLFPKVTVIHHGGASTKGLGSKRIQEFYRGLFRFYWKHYFRR